VRVDDERRSLSHVLVAAELGCDPERTHRFGVPVREQREVQVERLRPRDVRPGRIAGDPVRTDTSLLELCAPVTQELHFARSGGRPVEEVEDEQRAAVTQQLVEWASLVWRRPDARRGNLFADADHVANSSATATSVALAISLATSTMSRFALKMRSCLSAPLPLRRISSMPLSSRSGPSSRACGSSSLSVRRISCATGMRLRRPVARSISGASMP